MSQSRSGRSNKPSSSFISNPPFLNLINPMGRPYQGYTQANQSVLEENDENKGSDDDEALQELEAGLALSTRRPPSAKAQGKRRWDSRVSEMKDPQPNLNRDDKIHRERDSSDEEVPQDFKVEDPTRPPTRPSRGQALHSNSSRQVPPRQSATRTSLHVPPRPSEIGGDDDPRTPRNARGAQFKDPSRERSRNQRSMRGLDEYERALWNWVNVYNLDAFLQEVYYYYEGKGIYSIALARGLNLLTVGFVIGFSTFLLGCIDYPRIAKDKASRLADVIVDHCVSRFSGFTFIFFILFTAFYIWQIVDFVFGIMQLVDMYKFYTHLLKIPDADIQTISWPEVVRRIGLIREENPLTAISSKTAGQVNDTTIAKLDAHDIANRIMRKENYLIALFNKELLDLRVPLPRFLKRFVAEEKGKGQRLTQALEWNIRLCLMSYLFDEHGRVREAFTTSRDRAGLIKKLKERFIFMGICNAIFAPFIVLYLVMYSFFRYFEEYHKDPSSIGGRRYTSFAQWKFQEFNELPHFFVRRLHESYPLASMYIGQFPNEKVALIMRFVALIASAPAAVLLLATAIDPDHFLTFEVTPHRTVLFYLGIFTAILAVARAMIPDDNRVFDPEMLMTEVINYTHYMPDEWKNQLHSKKVHQEFGELFAMKIGIFFEELLSVALTPFILWFSLPACAPAIIDFFREFSVHVAGLGYVCSFAEFNFERHGNVKFGAPTNTQDKKMISNEGKMEKSFLNFKAANPDWNPSTPSGSLYLSRMADFAGHPLGIRRRGAQRADAMNATVHFAGETKGEVSLADKAQVYDRALRQSQLIAGTRRRGGGGGSIMGMSALVAAGDNISGSSVFGNPGLAQTAVLGDSQGSVHLPPPAVAEASDSTEELADNGLGESYVDGGKRAKPYDVGYEQDDESEDDDGVMGLLARIYGRRDAGPTWAM